MRLDLYGESITVPGQELYGELPGYLSKKRNSFCWLITSSKIDGDKAELQMINDYGSEDLTATLTVENDSLYVLKQVCRSGGLQKVSTRHRRLLQECLQQPF